ncbi:unnamed protein product [Didymodactylos carnosus]|uniref:Transmembrane protein 26 n=1 Tax=Didymodactylos carnosus TaxID=1234261 RepID=A0A8S2EDC3_9BILA|nr:unnamed protein product [Didymodactylos carnosus]CAF4004192.1 unnamed protein product [Didymodactylos carnosus]
MIVVIGRWVLPKGKISRSALSQLLLVYLSLASDMIDLLSIFQEETVLKKNEMVYSTLAVFSWSTFQFSLNLVATRGRTFNVEPVGTMIDNENNEMIQQKKEVRIELQRQTNSFKKRPASPESKCQWCLNTFLNNELYSIFITITMQDLPFLVLRLIAVIHFKVHSYTTLFFTCKNVIILLLQIYRLWSICIEKTDQTEQIDFDANGDSKSYLID